jgi:hypothetical protein
MRGSNLTPLPLAVPGARTCIHSMNHYLVFTQVPRSVEALSPKADFVAWIMNPEDKDPTLTKICDEFICRFMPGDNWNEVTTPETRNPSPNTRNDT